jgi:hypothetical protein
MRIEKKRLGTRVRVMLNQKDARDAARTAIESMLTLSLSMAPRTRLQLESSLALPRGQIRFFVGHHRGEGSAWTPLARFEQSCREQATASGWEVPGDASFRVGTNGSGQIVGATFQWWSLLDEEDSE